MLTPPLPVVAALSRLGYIPSTPPDGLAWCMSLFAADPAITVGQLADGAWIVGACNTAPSLTLAVMVAIGEAGMAPRVIERDQPTADFIAEATAHLERADALLELLSAAKDLESSPASTIPLTLTEPA